MFKKLALVAMCALSFAGLNAATVTYTVASTSSVNTTGDAPAGSTVTFAATNTSNKEQMTGGNSQTLTLSGYTGATISNITLRMKSNSSSGAGKLSYSTDGGSTYTYLVGTSSAGAKFNTASWNGAWSTSYVDVSKNVDIASYSGSAIIIKIEATANSLYCQSYTITYTQAATDPCTVTFNAGGGSCDTESLTESAGGAGVTLPDATTSVNGWSFVGWAAASIVETASTADLVGVAGDTYHPTADCTLYAVYKYGTGDTASSTSLNSTSTSAQTVEEGKPVTYTCSSSNSYSNPARIYKNNTFTVTSSGGNISKITLTGVADYAISNFTADSGTLTTSSNDGEWTGDAASVVFTAGAQVRVSALTVEYGGATTYSSYPSAQSEVNVTGVTLDTATLSLVETETATLTATVEPANATDKSVSWSTSDALVASVDNGVVTATGAGNATITVTTTDGSFTASCAVTVTALAGSGEGTAESPYDVARALALIGMGRTDSGQYVKGVVSETNASNLSRYYISDDATTTSQLYVYNGKYLDGAAFDEINKLKVGDEVVVNGNFEVYNTTLELTSSVVTAVNRLKAPTFSTPTCEFDQSFNLTLSTSTTGGAIYYTLDDTEPTASSTLYNESGITIPAATTTVKAVTVRHGILSEVVSATYTKVDYYAPGCTTQPEPQNYYIGAEAQPLSVGFNGYPVPTLQWYSNTAASTGGATAIEGATEATYTPDISNLGTIYYYCEATNSKGTAQSEIVAVTVSPKPTCDISWSVNGEVTATESQIQGDAITFPADPAVEGYSFMGWTTAASVNDDGSEIEFISASTPVPAAADVTYYAVFAKVEGEITTGTATLTNANIVAAGDANNGYTSWSLTDGDGKSWSAYAIKNYHSNATSANHYLQIKSGSTYYIQLPALNGNISKITMTVSSTSKPMDGGGATNTILYLCSDKSTDYEVCRGTCGASSCEITPTSAVTTGYILASGAVRIWDITVEYTSGSQTITGYTTIVKRTPTLAFEQPSYTFLTDSLGTIVAVSTDSEGAITYTSSDDNLLVIDDPGDVHTRDTAGTVTVTAHIAGTPEYAAGEAQVTVNIVQGSYLHEVNVMDHGTAFGMSSKLVAYYVADNRIYAYDEDNESCGYIYCENHHLSVGQVIADGWCGNLHVDNGQPTLHPLEMVVASGETSEAKPNCPTMRKSNYENDFSQLKGATPVRLRNVVLSSAIQSDGTTAMEATLVDDLGFEGAALVGRLLVEGEPTTTAPDPIVVIRNGFGTTEPEAGLDASAARGYEYVDGIVHVNGDVLEVYPTEFSSNVTAVQTIAADECGDAVYYNLQGIKVSNPASGSILIRRSGSTATKVLIK